MHNDLLSRMIRLECASRKKSISPAKVPHVAMSFETCITHCVPRVLLKRAILQSCKGVESTLQPRTKGKSNATKRHFTATRIDLLVLTTEIYHFAINKALYLMHGPRGRKVTTCGSQLQSIIAHPNANEMF